MVTLTGLPACPLNLRLSDFLFEILTEGLLDTKTGRFFVAVSLKSTVRLNEYP